MATQLVDGVPNVDEVRVRTTMPVTNSNPGASSINLIRVIREYGPVELEEIEAEIKKITERLSELRMKKETIENLIDVAG